MNRKIKFRAWDNENKYMITSKQGIFTALRNSMNITVQDNGYYNNGDLLKPNKEKYTLMQYTGLKDKNGVEVYEGDICKGNRFSSEDDLFVIKYGKYKTKEWKDRNIISTYQYGWYAEFIKSKDQVHLVTPNGIEVIGNIYENEVD
jgi:uncharacterized phage protein (TIGR01671 family)